MAEEKKTFWDFLNGDTPVLVDFYATWCGPCKMMAPELQAFAQERKGEVIVLKVDVDRNPQVARKYGVRAMPTLILFKGGEILWREAGAKNRIQIAQALSPHLSL